MKTHLRPWASATGHGPGVRRRWHTLTVDEQEREYGPYALYVSLTEYLDIRHGHQ